MKTTEFIRFVSSPLKGWQKGCYIRLNGLNPWSFVGQALAHGTIDMELEEVEWTQGVGSIEDSEEVVEHPQY